VIRFQKSQMVTDWKLEIKDKSGGAAPLSEMNEIYSFVQPENSNQIYMCGYKWADPTQEAERAASFFKMDDDGDILYFYQWGDGTKKDTCKSITYDETKKEVVLLLEVTSSTLRPDFAKYSAYSEENSDILIVRMSESGQPRFAHNINMDIAAISFGIGGHSSFVLNSQYVFGGQSFGFKTNYQYVEADATTPTLDSYVFKYDPTNNNDCFYHNDQSSSWLRGVSTSISTSLVEEKVRDRYLFKEMNNLYLCYSSRYSGAFDLLDTFRYPKMCAYRSLNMTNGVKYYRGQNENEYVIAEESRGGQTFSLMDRGFYWKFLNGTEATGLLGRVDQFYKQGTVFIQTDAEDAVGKQRTVLRGCSRLDELLELYLYVEVVTNNYPDFVTEIQTTWTLSVGDVYEYKLPKIKDKEENDVPEVYVSEMAKQQYPPFLFFNNITNTIIFRPESIWYQGRNYYFIITVKEKNSDTVLYPYYCTVKMQGSIIDPMEYLNFTDITWEMSTIDRESKSSLVFSHPVDLQFVKDNWDSMFHVYIKNVTFKDHQTPMLLEDFNITHLSDDNMTMNFTAKFFEPYMLGLLVKKSDRLYIHFRYDLLDSYGFFKEEHAYYRQMLFGNTSEIRVWPEKCKKDQEDDVPEEELDTKYREQLYVYQRIELQFDFRNDQMFYWRQLSIKMYWYLCGIVAFQFLFLFVRNLGLLPMWTLIEYMQLCAFIPLYNFKMIPYLYDAFKPFLVSHLILTNDAYVLKEFENDYFNINYDYYWLNIAKLAQALALICCGFAVILLIHLVLGLIYMLTSTRSALGRSVRSTLQQFHFNIYIRYYMLCYFDLTFFSVMKIVEGNNST